jgi:hypothetical protein
MPAATPTILATSGGFRPGRRTVLTPGPRVRHAIELGSGSGAGSDRPRPCYLGTAGGDQRAQKVAEVVAEVAGGAAYVVERAADGRVTERRLEPRRLPED